jgi:hypothetical protein
MDLPMAQARTRTDGFTTVIASEHPSMLVAAALQAWWVSLCLWPLDMHAQCLFSILLPPAHPTNGNPAHAMQVRERFATNGYVIFYGAVHEDTINSWRTIARQTEDWFDDEVNDMIWEEVRVKAAVPDQEARDMSRLLKRFYRSLFPTASAHDWHFIKTPPDTEDQPPRREFLTVPAGADIMDTSALPGSIVVATNNDTCFYAYGWNERYALQSNRRLLELNKGDVVIFRGDFIFAPVGYDSTNICLHAYLDSPVSDRPDDHHPTVVAAIDDTRPIEDPFCIVWNCKFKGTPLSLRRHLNRYHGIRFQHAPRHIEP